MASSWFLIDFLAVFPFQFFFKSDDFGQVKLIRIARLPKFIRILDVSKFDHLLEVILENTSRQEKMNILYASKYVYKVIRLIIIAVTLTYFLGCFWYYITFKNFFGDDESKTFYGKHNLE